MISAFGVDHGEISKGAKDFLGADPNKARRGVGHPFDVRNQAMLTTLDNSAKSSVRRSGKVQEGTGTYTRQGVRRSLANEANETKAMHGVAASKGRLVRVAPKALKFK